MVVGVPSVLEGPHVGGSIEGARAEAITGRVEGA